MMIFPFNISPTSVGLFLKECVLTHPLFIVFFTSLTTTNNESLHTSLSSMSGNNA